MSNNCQETARLITRGKTALLVLLGALWCLPCALGLATGTLERNLAYALNNTATSDSQKLDLFLPEARNYPTIVLVPGGIWTFADRKLSAFQEIAAKIQERGIGCALISHRTSPLYKHPAHARDVASAFVWVRKNIASRGGDPSRVFLMGHSSGAQLAALVACQPGYLAREGESSSSIRGLILLGAPLDLYSPEYDHLQGSDLYTTQIIQAFGEERSALREVSPMYSVHRGMPPVLLVYGDRDREAIKLQARRFCESLQKLGVKATLFEAPNRTHALTFLQLCKPDDTILPQVEAFIKSH